MNTLRVRTLVNHTNKSKGGDGKDVVIPSDITCITYVIWHDRSYLLLGDGLTLRIIDVADGTIGTITPPCGRVYYCAANPWSITGDIAVILYLSNDPNAYQLYLLRSPSLTTASGAGGDWYHIAMLAAHDARAVAHTRRHAVLRSYYQCIWCDHDTIAVLHDTDGTLTLYTKPGSLINGTAVVAASLASSSSPPPLTVSSSFASTVDGETKCTQLVASSPSLTVVAPPVQLSSSSASSTDVPPVWHASLLTIDRRFDDAVAMTSVRHKATSLSSSSSSSSTWLGGHHHDIWIVAYHSRGIFSISIDMNTMSIADDATNTATCTLMVGTGGARDMDATPSCTRLYHAWGITGSPYERSGAFYTDRHDGTVHRLSFGISQKMIATLNGCRTVTRLYDDVHLIIAEYLSVLVSTHIAGALPDVFDSPHYNQQCDVTDGNGDEAQFHRPTSVTLNNTASLLFIVEPNRIRTIDLPRVWPPALAD